MTAEIITVGDELLIGQVVNTNAAWLGEQLGLAGVEVVRMTTLGDDAAAIRHALDEAFGRAEVVVVTGGLGPTHDDVTREAVAAFAGVPLRFDEALFEQIRARFARRGYTIPESNRTQAMVPEGFDVLPNPVGTAPGLWWATEQEGRRRILVVLPGVPFEMRTLVEREVLPRLQAYDGRRVVRHRDAPHHRHRRVPPAGENWRRPAAPRPRPGAGVPAGHQRRSPPADGPLRRTRRRRSSGWPGWRRPSVSASTATSSVKTATPWRGWWGPCSGSGG
ncbi:MAG: hypothetical protein KatS3mg044_0048 [Rhodothermaceae bacterium]|nr:MAG: hypothetical protein KatS3mg044_0048 [Rhodothermaceae bacterium]